LDVHLDIQLAIFDRQTDRQNHSAAAPAAAASAATLVVVVVAGLTWRNAHVKAEHSSAPMRNTALRRCRTPKRNTTLGQRGNRRRRNKCTVIKWGMAARRDKQAFITKREKKKKKGAS
jgi:hypothetical protein